MKAMYLSRQLKKLNQKHLDALPALVLKGLSDSAIAGRLGVSSSTLKRWLEIGESGDPIESTPIHIDLYETYIRAKSQLEENLLSDISGVEDWRASAWLLERKFRDEYNPKITDLVTAQVESIVAKLSGNMSEGAFTEFINALTLAQNGYLPTTKGTDSQADNEETITIEALPT